MTFLQPFIMLGLPLVLVPVIIHLLNRLRHRPKPWAAMRFLLSATRSSIPVCTKVRKPGAVVSSLYGPTGRFVRVYVPVASAVTVRFKSVAVAVAVT